MRGGIEIGRQIKILLLTAGIILAIDQAAKALIMAHVPLNRAISVIPGFFNIVYYRNTGAAFGILNAGGTMRTVFLIAVSAAALVIIAIVLRHSRDILLSLALTLIGAGAVGNLIDRVRFGAVVDFLDLYAGPYHWPAFNVADTAITCGVLIALYSSYSGKSS